MRLLVTAHGGRHTFCYRKALASNSPRLCCAPLLAQHGARAPALRAHTHRTALKHRVAPLPTHTPAQTAPRALRCSPPLFLLTRWQHPVTGILLRAAQLAPFLLAHARGTAGGALLCAFSAPRGAPSSRAPAPSPPTKRPLPTSTWYYFCHTQASAIRATEAAAQLHCQILCLGAWPHWDHRTSASPDLGSDGLTCFTTEKEEEDASLLPSYTTWVCGTDPGTHPAHLQHAQAASNTAQIRQTDAFSRS